MGSGTRSSREDGREICGDRRFPDGNPIAADVFIRTDFRLRQAIDRRSNLLIGETSMYPYVNFIVSHGCPLVDGSSLRGRDIFLQVFVSIRHIVHAVT